MADKRVDIKGRICYIGSWEKVGISILVCMDRLCQATATGILEGVDYLRVAIKYLLFDLEATRRENSYLRKMLDLQTDGQ